MPPPGIPSPLPIATHVFRQPLPYKRTLELQEAIVQARSQARKTDPMSELARRDILLLLEHRPTFTTGRRDSLPSSLERIQREEERLKHAGADWAVTRRGGQVTFHGPGQVVGYCLFELGGMKLSTKCFVDKTQRLLADYVTHTLDGKKVFAPHPDDHVGVFPTLDSKISSMGIQIRQRLTSHGFSLNVLPDPLPWFDLIEACGLPNFIRATSLSEFTSKGLSSRTVRSVEQDLVDRFGRTFGPEEENSGVVDLMKSGEDGKGGVIGQLVRSLEKEVATDGFEWNSQPRKSEQIDGWPKDHT
ncbi:chloroplast lipoate protein ligase [Phaffia rhodozyma]|uniref:lipoyl(octanoyl) transferase n=1 Tax=Phaffia rhodozyma TaxID=264483 RepID=A0A0F7SIZ2_PHARH|nr:chloroplast lipoate protein ligase [Phaffia rhodozyma]